MKVISVLLVLAVLALGVYGLRLHGTHRGGALAKLGLAALLLFAGYAVLRPEDVTWLAERLGVGRGTDLVLYLLVVGFGFFAVSTYLRFRALELRFARLARTIALDRAEPPAGSATDEPSVTRPQ
ncbi:DUF2304 domain-containing protein [Nakamurella deserti]|uniref:DUF2304 domain-containing protein n=1 Tax=Nakamurella deserti TaxID=2164074 RepID=UPI000DBE4154|nr:DUF2304 domain-containing protein [Nakamurella deserti]